MNKCMLLLVFALLCGYADGCHAADCPRESEFLESVGKGCYYDNTSCEYTDTNGNKVVVWDYSGGPDDFKCATYVYACIYTSNETGLTNGWAGIPSCCSCSPGYELKWTSVNSSVCASSSDYYNGDKPTPSSGLSASHYICTQNCQPSNCMDGDWTKLEDGSGDVKITRSCTQIGVKGECKETGQEYRCALGYYDSSKDGGIGCKPCPSGTYAISKDGKNVCEQCPSGTYGISKDGKNACEQCPKWSGVYADDELSITIKGKSNAGATNITDCFVGAGTYYDSIGVFETDENCTGK